MSEHLLLVAEKPSLMRELKSVYQLHKSKIPYNIDFTALAGHVCMYANPREYKQWNMKWIELANILPMVPEKWSINVMPEKKDLYVGIKEKLDTGHFDGIICATDADREGNLIFHLLETKLGKKTKVYRLWVHDLTEDAILKSYENMVDFHKDAFQRNLTLASILRSRFDWLIGMNYTVCASVHTNLLMKIGRVKSPTLKMVYDNSCAIDNFIAHTTYGVEAEYIDGFTGMMFDSDGEIFFEKESDAKSIISSLKNSAKVISVEKEKIKTLPPQLFKLSDLQVYASKKFGFTADKTLSIAQSLYEKKILSYPRCDCRTISTESLKNFPKILDSLKNIPVLDGFISKISKNDIERIKNLKKYVNDKEVNENSHTALIPTGEKFNLNSLTEDETKIFKVIAARFVAIMFPAMIEERTVLIADNSGKTFRSTCKTPIEPGWSVIMSKNNNNTDNKQIPANIKNGDILKIKELTVKEHTTTPPARLTEGSLIAEMENISKYIEDNNLKTVMKEAKGIGTPSSRGAIIKSLIDDGYITVKGGKKAGALYISDKGKSYIENIFDLTILSPILTAEWEYKLREVEKGNLDATEFNNQMLKFLKDNISLINTTKPVNAKNFSSTKEVIGICPRCGKNIYESEKSFYCEGYKDEPKCIFSIWKDNKLITSQKKKVTATMVKKLLKDKRYPIKGLVSPKTGNKYDATIILEDTGTYVNLKIDFQKGGKK